MDFQAVFIYCLCSDTLLALNYKDDIQCKMTTAEIMTFVIISALHYQCNYKKTRLVVKSFKYFPYILSDSQLVRRIHKIPEEIWAYIFTICKEFFGVRNHKEFIVDSFPIPCCQNNKIFRCRLFKGKQYHGYNASKKAYFFGIKVHMIISLNGIPVEFIFTPGSESDSKGFQKFQFDLKEKSNIYADKAYTDYLQEDLLSEACEINLIPKRRSNLKRQNDPFKEFFLSMHRNKIETTFSSIVNFMPRCIRASTAKGFLMKVFFFIIGYSINRIHPIA